MRIILLSVLFLLVLSSCNVFRDTRLNQSGIKRTTERTFNSWGVISYFDREGNIERQINIFRNEVRSDYKFEYIVSDTLLEIRRLNTIGNRSDSLRIDRHYFTSSGHRYKRRVFLSSNPDNPALSSDNFVYENELLVSYTQGRNQATKVVYKYNEKRQLVQRILTTDGWTTFFTYRYNQLGQLTDIIQEVVNSDDDIAVLTGVVVWSSEKTNKVHIRYSNFDRRGNWRRSHFITERGRVLRSRRSIEYW